MQQFDIVIKSTNGLPALPAMLKRESTIKDKRLINAKKSQIIQLTLLEEMMDLVAQVGSCCIRDFVGRIVEKSSEQNALIRDKPNQPVRQQTDKGEKN